MKKFTDEQLKEIDKLVAIHLFGYAWFFYPTQEETKHLPPGDKNWRPRVEAYCALQVPADYQKRYGATRVDHPHPNDKLDIDIPAYHKDEDYVVEITQMSLDIYPERSLPLWKIGEGYCYGDTQKDHYETIPLALVMYTLTNFNVPIPF